jgi:diketogulonate reductase-like aldo/keto reductase
MANKTFKLNTGQDIPVIGLGTARSLSFQRPL